MYQIFLLVYNLPSSLQSCCSLIIDHPNYPNVDHVHSAWFHKIRVCVTCYRSTPNNNTLTELNWVKRLWEPCPRALESEIPRGTLGFDPAMLWDLDIKDLLRKNLDDLHELVPHIMCLSDLLKLKNARNILTYYIYMFMFVYMWIAYFGYLPAWSLIGFNNISGTMGSSNALMNTIGVVILSR